jgi:hypothetical protein
MLHCEDRSPFTQINAALRKRLNQEKIETAPGISKIKIASVSFSTRSTLDAPGTVRSGRIFETLPLPFALTFAFVLINPVA